MLRSRPLAAPILAALLALFHASTANGQTRQPAPESANLALESLRPLPFRPLHWGLQSKVTPAVNEVPQNAYLSFYVTGAVLIVLGTTLALISTARLYDAVQRANVGDEVTESMAVGAEGLLAIVGGGFVALGAILHSDPPTSGHPAAPAGTVHAMLGPTPNGTGAFGALTITF